MSGKAAINLQKPCKTYSPGETIVGSLEIDTGGHEVTHEGIELSLEGQITLLRPKISLSDRERIPLMNSTVQIVKAGKLPAKHKLNIPFNMVFEKSSEFENELLETYHGVNISIEYYMRGRVKRGLLSMQNILTQQMEIYASSRPIQGTVSTKAREFIMTPESVEISNVENNNTLMQPSQLPGNIEFQIKGHLDSVAFSLDDPLTGSIRIIKTSEAIKSIELLLLRVEELPSESFKQSSEVQNIQVAEGNPILGLSIPLYMVFPRHYACPSQDTSAFKISFQVSISVIFIDNHIVSQTLPITLYR